MAEPARAPPPPLSPNQRRGSAFPRRSSTLENLEKANERIKSLAGNGAGLGLAPDPKRLIELMASLDTKVARVVYYLVTT